MAVHSREAAAAGVDAGGGLRQAPGATAAERASGPTSGQRTLGSPRCLVYPRPGPGRDGRRGQAHGLTWSPTVYPRHTNGRCLCCWLRGGSLVTARGGGAAGQGRVLGLHTMTSRPRPSPSRACPAHCHTAGGIPRLSPRGPEVPPQLGQPVSPDCAAVPWGQNGPGLRRSALEKGHLGLSYAPATS